MTTSHIAVNFHYVGMPPYEHAGIYGLSPDGFRNAVTAISEHCELITLATLLDAVQGNTTLPQKACLLTFDDGLRCQYEQALPILDSMGVEAAYFVSGMIYENAKALQVHKIHWTRATLGDSYIRELIYELFEDGKISDHTDNMDVSLAMVGNYYDSEEQAKLKYLLNYHLTTSEVDTILTHLLLKIGITEHQFIEMYYMTSDMVKELAERNMIGSHAMSHRPLAAMEPHQIEGEMTQSKAILERITGCSIQAVSYPFGTTDAVNTTVGKLARKSGYLAGYTMENALNKGLDDALLFARIDATAIGQINDLLPRKNYLRPQSSEESPA